MQRPMTALEYVERGEERRRAVSFVIVRRGRAPAVLQGQPRLGPIERLNLRLLVDREHHGMRRRIDVEPGDVAQPGGELRVGGELEGAHPVGLQLVRPPDAPHRGDADPGGFGHRRRRPVGGLVRRFGRGQRDHAIDDRLLQGRDTRRPRLVAQKPVHAVRHEPLLPAPDARLRLAAAAHDLGRAETVRGRQDDLRPPDVLLRAVPVRDDRFQTGTIGGADFDGDVPAHAHRLAHPASHGNPMSDALH
jgi:hypothetical protein